MTVARSETNAAARGSLRAAWLGRALVACGIAASGCGGAYGAPQIERTVGGERRTGSFVSPYSYEHFLLGELAATQGDLRRAQDEYRMARAGAQDDPLLIARLADVVDRAGNRDGALAILREGDELDPCSEPVWLTRGEIHARHGAPAEAIDAFARAAACAPDSEEAPIRLATLLREVGRIEEADAVLGRYLARARGAGAARARLRLAVDAGDPFAAAEAVRALLAVAPARADDVRAAVRTALEANRPELARLVIAALPEGDQDRELRLRVAIEARDRSAAEALLAQWMPQGATETLAVARGYLAIGMVDRAIELAQVALSLEAGAEARLLLGRALAQRGELARAAAELATIEPGSVAWPAGPIALADVLAASGRPALGAQSLVAAIARRPSIDLSIALARARRSAGDAQGALRALEGSEPELAAARAGLLEQSGALEPAVRTYAALPRDDRRLSERDRARAVIEAAWASGDHRSAIERLQAWTERAPEDLLARARLAELLAASERVGEAREVAAEVLPLAADPTLRQRLAAIAQTGAPRSAAREPADTRR